MTVAIILICIHRIYIVSQNGCQIYDQLIGSLAVGFDLQVEENDVDEDYDQPAFRRSHDWRQEHEELKANVRQAKRASRAKKEAKVQPGKDAKLN